MVKITNLNLKCFYKFKAYEHSSSFNIIPNSGKSYSIYVKSAK
jgi:hypothetical protein